MVRFLLFIILFFNCTYANTEKYFIRFGSFKNLKGLERHIDSLPSSLRSHVVIVRANSWYIPLAYYTSNRNALKSKLPLYKHYFKDAHIASSSSILNYPLVRNYTIDRRVVDAPKRQYISPVRVYKRRVPQYQNVAISEGDHILTNLSSRKVLVKREEESDIFQNREPKKYKKFSKEMLSGNHYYLAYKKTDSNPDLLVKVNFGNHVVTYQPIIGEMKMTQANYLVEEGKLYMFIDTFTRNGSFSTLEEHRDDHFLVSSWLNGKKLNTLRYYYKMNDAKRYLGSDPSDGLAEVLSEGEFDDFFLDE